jgi:uncharacterized protein YaiI (UPF0178 family)
MSQIWIDGDATPQKIKELLIRASQRRNVPLIFVANQYLSLPRMPTIRMVVVAQGFDKADDYIAENTTSGELVITADIPLANRCIEKEAEVLTPRGKVLDKNNIGPILSARNFNEELRNSGVLTKGPNSFTKKDIQVFANALDRWIARSGC